MNCWHCDRPSNGQCRFCGRALCKSHIQKMPFILAVYQDATGEYKALVVNDTLYCGVCKPKDEPVSVKQLGGVTKDHQPGPVQKN